MSFLYINEQGAAIGLERGYYVVRQKDGGERKIPEETLESITIFGNAHMTEACMRTYLQQGVLVDCFLADDIYFEMKSYGF